MADKKASAAASEPLTPITFRHQCIERGPVYINGEMLYARHGRLTVDEPAQIATLDAHADWHRVEGKSC